MIRVTKSNKCPVCDHESWCCLSDDLSLVVCMRVPSPLPAKAGGGHIHILKDRPMTRQPLPPPPTRLRKFDAEKYHAKIRAEWDHVWLDGTALSLGVDEDALERLQPGWDNFHKSIGFPMRNEHGTITGIRLRNWKAQKWAVSGSSDGLFFDPSLTLGDEKEIVVVEGPTDTAAAYTLNLPAVGRSSCQTGTELLKSLCKRLGVRLVTIVSDNDSWKSNPFNDQLRRPGLDGAIALGKSIGRLYRIVVPPKKDLRQWLAEGLTQKQFESYAGVSIKRMS